MVFTRYVEEEAYNRESTKEKTMTGIFLSILAIFGLSGGPTDFGDSCSAD